MESVHEFVITAAIMQAVLLGVALVVVNILMSKEGREGGREEGNQCPWCLVKLDFDWSLRKIQKRE